MKVISKDLIAASTIPIVLSILKEGDDYGYNIIKKVTERSNGNLKWNEGSLYPVLLKLGQKGCIRSYTIKERGRNRKYYTIQKPGYALLEKLKGEWLSLNKILGELWTPTVSKI